MADNSAAQENQWACTEMKVSKCRYTWTIKNLKFFRNNTTIISPMFQVAGNNGSKWFLQLYPKGKAEHKEFCSLYLNLESCLSSEIAAKYKFLMLTSENDRGTKDTFQKERSFIFEPGSGCGFHDFIRRDMLFDEAKGLVHGGQFTIVCEMHVFDETVNTQGYLVPAPKCKLSEDFEILFKNENFSDVTLASGGCEYHMHKAILAARSKVFAGMFTHDMEESRSNHVNIPDIGGDVCKEMLHFIYTGKTPNLDKVADGLLAAADKYELIVLKALCEETLTRKLSVENVTATLILADLHSADYLKTQAVNFIAIHTLDVYQTEGWKKMSSSHLPLLMETLLTIEKSKTCQTNSNK